MSKISSTKFQSQVYPDQIILFGSRALGTARKDSDVDLLLIYSASKAKRELKQEIYHLFPHPDFLMDLFVVCATIVDVNSSSSGF